MASARGFSLIEIMIALAIVAILAGIGFSRLRQQQGVALDRFTESVNRLVRLAYVRALTTGKLHRLYFSFMSPALVRVEEEAGRDSKGARVFARVPDVFISSEYQVGERFLFDNFFIMSIDEAARGGMKDAWLYVFPSGITQPIVMNVRDAVDNMMCGMVLNPFSVRFTVYDTYQKP